MFDSPATVAIKREQETVIINSPVDRRWNMLLRRQSGSGMTPEMMRLRLTAPRTDQMEVRKRVERWLLTIARGSLCLTEYLLRTETTLLQSTKHFCDVIIGLAFGDLVGEISTRGLCGTFEC